ERMRLRTGKDAANPAGAGNADAGPAPNANDGAVDAVLRNLGLAALLPRLAATAAQEAVLTSAQIAERLRASVRIAPPVPRPPQRDDGVVAGTRWATSTATLDELQQVAALQSTDWSGMRLAPSHSMVAALAEAGVLPASVDDRELTLDRDAFVEGIVEGASQVLRSAGPHLTGNDAPTCL